MRQTRYVMVLLASCAVSCALMGCPSNSAGSLAGRWQYVAVDATTTTPIGFRAFLHFAEPSSGGLGGFEYKEELLLPDNDDGETSWHPSYYASGYYRTAPYGYTNGSDIFTYWADAALNVVISEYAPELAVSVDEETGDYVYELITATPPGDAPAHSRAVFTITPFDELVIAWGNHVPGAAGAGPVEKGITINEGIVADTYVRVSR